MFSTMTNQMSSWLGGMSKKQPDSEVSAHQCESESSDKDQQESKVDTPTSERSVKGSIDGDDIASSTTEGADTNAGSPVDSASDDKLQMGVSEKFNQGAKTFGTFLSSAFSKAGRTVSQAGTKLKKSVAENSVLADFYKENEAFSNAIKKHGAANPPWLGLPDEQLLRDHILSMSTERRNFVRSPPTGADFQFDLETHLPVAAAILKQDDNLQKMRYELVPKVVSEDAFWRNYFYRVSLIKQSTQLSCMAHQRCDSLDSSPTGSVDVADSSPGDDEDDSAVEAGDHVEAGEFVSDAVQPSIGDLEEVRAGVRQLGVNKQEEWERELNVELGEYELVRSEPRSGAIPSAKVDGDSADWESEVDRILKEQAVDIK